MCPGATAAQNLVCSTLDDYETAANPATCVECGKAGQECCIGDSVFLERVCEEGFACTDAGCAPCGCASPPPEYRSSTELLNLLNIVPLPRSPTNRAGRPGLGGRLLGWL